MRRPHLGRHRRPMHVAMTDVEIEVESLFSVLRHLEDGRSVDDAWALGEIDATDMLAARAAS